MLCAKPLDMLLEDGKAGELSGDSDRQRETRTSVCFHTCTLCLPYSRISKEQVYVFIELIFVPDVGLNRLQDGELLPSCAAASPCASSLTFTLDSPPISSSSLSAVSSAADSLSDGSGEVTLTSTLISPDWGCTAASRSEWQDEEEEGGGGVRASATTVVVVVVRSVLESSVEPSAAAVASFCFWSCSFWRLRCFLRNLARRFLNHT